MPFRFGPLEIVIILVIIVMIFGVGKLPQVTESLGRGLRSLRRSRSGDSEIKVISKLEDDEAQAKPIKATTEDKIEPKSS